MMPITKYATTTSFKPKDGCHTIVLPEGCIAVLYVFSDRHRATQVNGSDDLVELTESRKNWVNITVDPNTGETHVRRTT